METIVCIVYLTSGIIILSALCLSIAYHFQRMHYVVLKEWLHLLYVYSKRKSAKVVDERHVLEGPMYEHVDMGKHRKQGFMTNVGRRAS